MKKIGIITFHAAHNYGSVLQAYAMKKIVSNLGCDAEIINFRTDKQKDQYTPLTKRKGLKYIIKNTYFLLHYISRKSKYDKFENFINEYLLNPNQPEYSSLDELEQNVPQYDMYISGSDQIWNTNPNDADMAYFLPFVKEKTKISYAPSFGQLGNIKYKNVISKYLNDYDYLSIRDEFGKDLIKELTGRSASLLPDPTLVVDRSIWNELTDKNLMKEKYLFFYTLFATQEMIDIVKRVSKELNLPVVISNVSNQYEIFSGFKKIRNAGPKDFLSLIKNAEFVCVTSFHGTIFSILMHKPFFAINGMDDNRINTLLTNTGLVERSISLNDIDSKLKKAYDSINYNDVDYIINSQRKLALNYLQNAMGLL